MSFVQFRIYGPNHGSEILVADLCCYIIEIHGAVCGAEVVDGFVIAPFCLHPSHLSV